MSSRTATVTMNAEYRMLPNLRGEGDQRLKIALEIIQGGYSVHEDISIFGYGGERRVQGMLLSWGWWEGAGQSDNQSFPRPVPAWGRRGNEGSPLHVSLHTYTLHTRMPVLLCPLKRPCAPCPTQPLSPTSCPICPPHACLPPHPLPHAHPRPAATTHPLACARPRPLLPI